MPIQPAQSALAPGLQQASWLRRIAALVIDWFASTLVAIAIVGGRKYFDGSSYSWVPLVVFLVQSGFGTALVGGSFGQRLLGISVLSTNGRPVSLLMALFRSLLICLVIPPLVFQPDGRGLHDLWTRSGAFHTRR